MTTSKPRSLKKSRSIRRRNNLIFYCLLLAFPVLQFCVFYIGVNFNSFLLAFQNIQIDGTQTTVTWTFDNIKEAFRMMTTADSLGSIIANSFLSYFLLLIIGAPLALFFSYYIYKKHLGHSTFKVMLFLPAIISSIIMVTIFSFFVERAVPVIVNKLFDVKITGLLENKDTRYATIIFYNVLISFGTSVLIYSNGMEGISTEIMESAKLDGFKPLQEFWHIVLPLSLPTIKTFLLTGIAAIFVSQIELFSFFGPEAPINVQTFGYYLYTHTEAASSETQYPLLAALGLLSTFITVPLTLLLRWALEKLDPNK